MTGTFKFHLYLCHWEETIIKSFKLGTQFSDCIILKCIINVRVGNCYKGTFNGGPMVFLQSKGTL